jgi:carbon monoxide dehydrogenase subunit G
MDIQKSFELSQSPQAVWDAFSDVRLVASCLPGASIVEERGSDQYKGRFSVKVGPLAAAFEGDVGIERQPEALTGTVSGKGADAKSGSRASGKLSYRLEPAGAGTRVDVVCEINLAGALAQFGKAAVIREIANRLTGEFVKNFEARLAASAPVAAMPTASPGVADASAPSQPTATAQPLDAGRLGWSILRDWIVSWLRGLFGRKV